MAGSRQEESIRLNIAILATKEMAFTMPRQRFVLYVCPFVGAFCRFIGMTGSSSAPARGVKRLKMLW